MSKREKKSRARGPVQVELRACHLYAPLSHREESVYRPRVHKREREEKKGRTSSERRKAWESGPNPALRFSPVFCKRAARISTSRHTIKMVGRHTEQQPRGEMQADNRMGRKRENDFLEDLCALRESFEAGTSKRACTTVVWQRDERHSVSTAPTIAHSPFFLSFFCLGESSVCPFVVSPISQTFSVNCSEHRQSGCFRAQYVTVCYVDSFSIFLSFSL